MKKELTTTTKADEVNKELIESYFKTMTENLNDKQRAEFMAVCVQQNLNPFKREIYAVNYNSKMNIIVGYEVYLKRAEMCPTFDGYDTEFVTEANDLACICRVYRKDRNHPTCSKVFLKEYTSGKNLWGTKPKCMLEKVAIATAFRRCFPNDFNGIPYMKEELEQSFTPSEPQKVEAEIVEHKSDIPTEEDFKKFAEWEKAQKERLSFDRYNYQMMTFKNENKKVDIFGSKAKMREFMRIVKAMPDDTRDKPIYDDPNQEQLF